MYSISPPRLMNSRGRVLEDIMVLRPLKLSRKRTQLANTASSNACQWEVCVFGKASSGCQATKKTANQSAVRHDVVEAAGSSRCLTFNLTSV